MFIRYTLFVLLINNTSLAQIRIEIDSMHRELDYVDHDTSRVMLLADLGHRYLNFNPDSSLVFAQQALTLAKEIKYLRGEARALATLGNTTRFLGDISEGMELLFNGLQIAQHHNFPFEAAVCLNGIGVVYADELQDHRKAIIYYRQAEQFFNNMTKQNASEQKYAILFDIDSGISYQQTGQFDSSLFYLQRSLKTAVGLQSRFYPVTLMFMGDLQFAMGNPNLAMEYLHESIRVNQKSYDPRLAAESYNFLAGFFKIMKQIDSASFYAVKALENAQSINHKQAILKATMLLAQLNETTDIAKAYKYLKLARATNEELYGAKKVQNLQRLISDEQERQRNIEAAKIAYQNRLQQYALLAGLGITFLIGFILYRINRRKQKTNDLLHQQKEQIQSTLTRLKSTQSQLIQSEKMASLGELTVGIAHEIQNPLNFVNNFSEVNKELLSEMKEEIEKRNFEEAKSLAINVINNQERINEHGKRADAIVKAMLQHSRNSSGIKEPTNINALTEKYLKLAYHGFRAKDKNFNVNLKTSFDEDLGTLNVIPQDISRVILNLLNNAFYAIQEKNKTTVDYEPAVSITTRKSEDKALISVKDNGNGIPQSIVDKIFQPFFTSKPTGQGTGLGLSLSYDIVKAHGGTITVKANENDGAEFVVEFPMA